MVGWIDLHVSDTAEGSNQIANLFYAHTESPQQELYEGEAAVAAHETTDRMQALLPKLQGLCKNLRLVHGLVAAETL